jgi:CDP-diacylglycerol--serine O-phosphatidyltransferase
MMMMNRDNLKFLVPNGITFLSLLSGFAAIISAVEGNIILGAILIFLSYWLDMLDGFFARKLNAQSEFGLQLDSLADIVSLGVAPAVLVFQHLRNHGASMLMALPIVILFVLAGAFRLARFNLLPPKTARSKDSIGLAITQAGGTLALAVLADSVYPTRFLSSLVYIPLILLLAGLMVSTIPFPPSSWFFSRQRFGRPLLILLLLMLVILPTFRTWFVFYLVYILISTGRALITRFMPRFSL